MWLFEILLGTLAFVLIAGSLAGGIFTIELVPLGVLLLIAAGAGALLNVYRRVGPRSRTGDRGNALPREKYDEGRSTAPTTPEELADARRAAQ